MQLHGNVREGMKAITADGESLGKIIALHDDDFVIEKGIFFPKDYVARYDDVDRVSEDTAILRLRKEEFEPLEREEATVSAAETTESRSGEVRIPVTEEELTATTRTEKVGEVRVRKEVKTEQERISVPVTREEVKVERVASGEPASPGETVFREGEVVVPVYEEKVEVEKRPVVKEEVRVSKEAHRETHTEREPVRREEVHVEEGGKPRRS